MKLQSIGEERLLDHWEELNELQKETLLQQIAGLDVALFRRQQEELRRPESATHSFEPFIPSFFSGNQEDAARGFEALKEGRCAALILAGGQGSRFRCKGPKGCVPVTSVKQKTLFRLLAEKIKAASRQVERLLEVAIMTSPLNHLETELYFVQNAFFGLDPRQIHFFYQRMWPFLDFEGHLFLEAPDQIARGPNGNGGVFRRLVEVGLAKKWEKMGVEMVQILPIDNPLALPYDHELLGFHQRQQCEVVIKASLKRAPDEKVGILVRDEGKTKILEYSEISPEQKGEVANLGLFSFSLDFIERASQFSLPLHKAKKAVNENSVAWKFEEFIFDVLPLANRCEALLYPREAVFAPLKNLTGEDSIETVRMALLNADRATYRHVTGVEAPKNALFELSASFYYPTEELTKRWRGRALPELDYIEDIG